MATAKKPATAEAKPEKASKPVVISEFRDKSDFSKVYSIGDDVSHFDEKRLQSAIKSGLVK